MNIFLRSGAAWAALVLAAMLMAAPAGAQTSGAELFGQGRYTEAYAALWPGITAGQPEAVFYGLVIRRNGLDGRAPARGEEIAALWAILAANADYMRQSLAEGATPKATRLVYLTALAQLEYFGPNPPPWPPAPADPARRASAPAVVSGLGPAVGGFTPAMNFQAFLMLDAYEGREKQARGLSQRAAEAGDHLAMANLARLYREGLGGGKNNLRAAYWARRGAEARPPVPRAQNEMGYCYELGLGVSRDLTEAARWYKLGAAQGYPPAVSNDKRLRETKENQAAGASALGLPLAF